AEDREVGPADPLIPQQHDRTQEGNEGNEDGAEVHVLLELRHRFEHTEVICAVLPSIGTSAMPKLEQSHNPPWEQLDPSVAEALAPAVPGLVDEVIAAVGAAVPEYEGQLDANVRRGVQQGLEGFLQLVAGDDTVRLPGREVYVAFGRGEWRAGRSLEALLAAYRAGAQVAWRELSATGDARGLPPRTLYTLAEAIFAYIDEISAASAEGFAQQQSAAARELGERRRRLLELLLDAPVANASAVEAAAVDAEWELPRRLAALTFAGGQAERV